MKDKINKYSRVINKYKNKDKLNNNQYSNSINKIYY